MNQADTLRGEPIVIYRIGDQFRLEARTLGIASEDRDLDIAYAKLQRLAGDCRDDGSIPLAPHRELGGMQNPPASDGMRRLLQVTTLILMLSVLPLVFFAASALSSVANTLARVRGATDLVSTTGGVGSGIAAGTSDDKRRFLVQTLHAVAQDVRSLTPERKQEVLEDVRAIVRATQPFADAVRPLFTAVPENLDTREGREK